MSAQRARSDRSVHELPSAELAADATDAIVEELDTMTSVFEDELAR